MKIIKILSLSLALLLLFSCAACQKSKTDDTPSEESTERSYKPASEVGITDYGWIPANSILQDEDLLTWFEKSLSRTSVSYAVLYAKDEATNIWYCWLYAEGYNADDTVTLSVDDTDGTHILMDVSVKDPSANATGVFCFAIPSETEPTFSLTANGIRDGLIVTLGDAPIKPLK